MTEIDVKVRKEAAQQPSSSRPYRGDLFGWVQDQMALLNAGKLSEIDAQNIAEELFDVGDEQYDKLESAIRVVLQHLLKWDHQPDRRSRSWVLSIREHRRRIDRVLKKNPSLKPSIQEAIHEGYEDARDDAIKETELPDATFPSDCPYDWKTITDRSVEIDDARSPRKR